MIIEKVIELYIDVLKRQKEFGCKPMPLTNDEKFAIAVMGGVHTHVETGKDPKFSHLITERCGVGWDGRKFLVLRSA